jgi:signal transduction histidine kinase
MTRRLPIRWRIAVTSVALVLAVLIIVGATVIVLEQRSLDSDLRTQATIEARSLLAVAARAETAPTPERDENTPTGKTGITTAGTMPTQTDEEGITIPPVDENESLPKPSLDEADTGVSTSTTRASRVAQTVTLDPSTEPYLVRRSASDTLLAVRAPHGLAVVNEEEARALVPLLTHGTGTSEQTINGVSFTVAIARDEFGITTAAAVPRTDADARISALVRALLLAGGLGALLTIVLAWLGARRALRPLTVMTSRAESVTAGRLDQRVGPIGGEDEIARLTHAIDAMLARLEGSFAAQQRFVQDASHELRTPITIARGHLEVLNPEREDPASVQAEIDLAVDELDRMGRLVERLLTLARAGEIPATTLTKVDVNELAKAALERVRSDVDRHWVLDTADGHPVVLGDRDALVDVLVNLLRNAERHTTPSGMIALRVESGHGTVRIIVADDGEGIPAALLPTIFDRFTRADAARTRDAGGVGLGLAICRAYVVAQNGTISVSSKPGHGATFTITLPSVS